MNHDTIKKPPQFTTVRQRAGLSLADYVTHVLAAEARRHRACDVRGAGCTRVAHADYTNNEGACCAECFRVLAGVAYDSAARDVPTYLLPATIRALADLRGVSEVS